MSQLMISIPLAEYLQLRWSYKLEHGAIKNFATLSREQGLTIKALDPEELICHIEFPEAPEQQQVCLAWEKKAWVNSQERWHKMKLLSNWEREFSGARKDLEQSIVEKLRAITFGVLTTEQMLRKARELTEKADWEFIATNFGIDCAVVKAIAERKPK